MIFNYLCSYLFQNPEAKNRNMLIEHVEIRSGTSVAEVISEPPTSKPKNELILAEKINNQQPENSETSLKKERRNPPRRARLSANSDLIRRGHVLDKDLKFLDKDPTEDEKVLAGILSQTFKV